MFDTRKKATMSQVLADIKPYLTKRFLSEPVTTSASASNADVYTSAYFALQNTCWEHPNP